MPLGTSLPLGTYTSSLPAKQSNFPTRPGPQNRKKIVNQTRNERVCRPSLGCWRRLWPATAASTTWGYWIHRNIPVCSRQLLPRCACDQRQPQGAGQTKEGVQFTTQDHCAWHSDVVSKRWKAIRLQKTLELFSLADNQSCPYSRTKSCHSDMSSYDIHRDRPSHRLPAHRDKYRG